MRCLVMTDQGTESIAAHEVKEILGYKAEIADQAVIFDSKDPVELCKFSYLSQSAVRVIMLLKSFRFKSLDDLEKKAASLDVSAYLKDDIGFSSRCIRVGSHDFNTLDVEGLIGGIIADATSAPVKLDSPNVIFLTIIKDDMCYIGIDMAGFSLSKRQYYLFGHPTVLKGTIAYSLVRMSGFKRGETLVDPFTRNASIPIEAGLYAAGMSPHYFSRDRFMFMDFWFLEGTDFTGLFEAWDKASHRDEGKVVGYDSVVRHVRAAQKNAKVAGINKRISILKGDISWLDTKYKEGEIDRLVCYPPQPSHRKDPKDVLKRVKELFYQMEYALSLKGTAVIATRVPDFYKDAAKQYSVKLSGQREIYQGHEKISVLVFKRTKARQKA